MNEGDEEKRNELRSDDVRYVFNLFVQKIVHRSIIIVI
jgi:hypothetical protein